MNRTALFAGVFFLVMGVLFLLDELDVISLRIGYVGPIILIVLGVIVLVGGRLGRSAGAAGPRPLER